MGLVRTVQSGRPQIVATTSAVNDHATSLIISSGAASNQLHAVARLGLQGRGSSGRRRPIAGRNGTVRAQRQAIKASDWLSYWRSISFHLTILLMTGPELSNLLLHIWSCPSASYGDDWLKKEWLTRALILKQSTPDSFLDILNSVEDSAVQQALVRRHERAEAELQARLQAEAEAHRDAQERKAEAARVRLTRARLVAFYRKHAPSKEGNIDKIMEQYADRYELLDSKLKAKYGEGFNPALRPKQQNQPITKATNKLMLTINQGFNRVKTSEEDEDEKPDDDLGLAERVSPLVSAAEVLPSICWSKDAVAARGESRRRRFITRKQVKFYLFDSRPEESVFEQGSFPTAMCLSPEIMHDPEKLKEKDEMFESLRGAVHIVVMGEGFGVLPELYKQKLSPKLAELMRQDDARTNSCALFFVKKGFPFVSVLNGGFAAAYSWLVREGPTYHLNVSAVLIDYDPLGSMFGQLETLHNASASEKAQRKMQNLLDKSLIVMTKRAQQLERLAEAKEGGLGLRITSTIFGGSASDAIARLAEEDATVQPGPAPTQSTNEDSSESKDEPADVFVIAENDSTDIISEKASDEVQALKSDSVKLDSNRTSTTLTRNESGPADTSKTGIGSISFRSFGAAIDTAANSTVAQNVLKRTPFMRFGSGGVTGAANSHSSNTNPGGDGIAESAPTSKPTGGFGFGQFGQAFARIRSGNATVGAGSREDVGDESITFAPQSKVPSETLSSPDGMNNAASTAESIAQTGNESANVQRV